MGRNLPKRNLNDECIDCIITSPPCRNLPKRNLNNNIRNNIMIF